MAMSKTKQQGTVLQAVAEPLMANENAEGVLQVPGVRLCVSPNQTQQEMRDACEEAIRELAHQKWEAAGCPAGDGQEFWLLAEQEVTAFQSLSFEA